MIYFAWFDEEQEIIPIEKVYPKQITRNNDTFNKNQMDSSQINAQVAALNEMSMPPKATMIIIGVDEKSTFINKLEKR